MPVDEKQKIMIVDDDKVSLKLLENYLDNSGYECIVYSDSVKARDRLGDMPAPNLFLLDLFMPEVTGIDLCKKIKSDKKFKDIPVIFLTSESKTSQKIVAFDSGAVDYITKPIDLKEVAIRIGTHLELYRAHKKLEEYAYNMEKLAEERAKQLVHADRLATIGTLAAGMGHEINNPTTFISGNVQTMERFWGIIKPLLEKMDITDPDEKSKLEFVKKEMPDLLYGIKDGVSRIKRIVDSLKVFSRKETSNKQPVRIEDCIENSLVLCRKLLKDNMKVDVQVKSPGLMILADMQKIEQVLINIMINAAHATEKIKNAGLFITVYKNNNGMATINLTDNGPGIPEHYIEKIWDPFFTTKEAGKGTGLGLPIAREIIESHNGAINAFNRKEGGANFEIILPIIS